MAENNFCLTLRDLTQINMRVIVITPDLTYIYVCVSSDLTSPDPD